MSETTAMPISSLETETVAHVEHILSSKIPTDALLEVLVETESRPAIAANVYEAVAPRINISNYWIYYRISRAYFVLGRDDACYASALAAIQMEPTYQHWHMFENIFNYFKSRGRYCEALDIARFQIAHTPEIPIVSPHELAHIARQADMPLDEHTADAGERARHLVHPTSVFRPERYRRYGLSRNDTVCAALDSFSHEVSRPEVVVWELNSPEIVVFDRNVLIFDDRGVLQSDISVCEFPEALAQKVSSPVLKETLPVHEADDAVIIADKFGTANVCHFLLDHVTRLALYDGLTPTRYALVIGPSLLTDYQQRIVQRLGITKYQGTTDRCVIHPARLFVSETCKKSFVHPAHIAADWAVSYLKDRFSFAPFDRLTGRRLYISRKDASVRFVRNEETVLARLRACKFEEIVLSDFDYDEQAALFAQSTHVVGMHGAGLTNMVFCPSGVHFLEICHPVSGTATYAVVGASLDIEYAALIGRDADSDDAMHNDAVAAALGLGMGGAQVLSNRDVLVDLAELDRWLRDSGASS